ncbi:hypothetical protein EHS25_008966 [Saitozyma podzolica]|uniref:Xylanolytic transcriptional activator regulatory domain-containing protein n=1 Tax=Saitozyma podzolica TaxID=1890683 RepID=A0A427YKL2_9TREE|nr:hypothetical protein EHS25_008966 [Saitozyma podzolica]
MTPVGDKEAEASTVARMLDTFAMGNRITRNELRGFADHEPPPRSPLLIEHMRKVLSILPAPQHSRQLVAFYFRKVEWYTGALHQAWYEDELQQLITCPPEMRPYLVRPCWLCLHLAVLCLSEHLLVPVERESLGLPDEQGQEIARALFLASKELLFASDFYYHHTIEHLQCIILHGVYQYNTDEAADSHWALLGSAIKIAQNLGLNRLGPENKANEEWPGSWQDPVRRDIGRRIWWNIVLLDWSMASAYGSTYLVKPDLPYSLCYSPGKSWITEESPGYGITQLCDGTIEERFLALRKAFPPYMESIEAAQSVADRLDSPNIVFECLLLRMCDQSYILRLHRPYQVMGYGNDEYRYSADRCVQAAKAILLDFHAAWLECPFLLNFWLVPSFVCVAGVVTF